MNHGDVEFDVRLSIEKDELAHRTLTLRKFFRQFPSCKAPEEYYQYIRGEISLENLYTAYPEEKEAADHAAQRLELGRVPFKDVAAKIEKAVDRSGPWVLIGGPPCQAYSTIGRARMRGHEGFEDDHRHTLYREYLKIVAAYQPTVFVMENVKGILSSKYQGKPIFSKILEDLADPWTALTKLDKSGVKRPSVRHRYRIHSFSTPSFLDGHLSPNDYLIESERYGIAQSRHRVILLGIRDDLEISPPTLEPAGSLVTVRQVIGGMPRIRSRLSSGEQDTLAWADAIQDGYYQGVFDLESSSKVARRVMQAVDRPLKRLKPGATFIPGEFPSERLWRGWFEDKRLGGVIQHEARSHMQSDLWRYLFAAAIADVRGLTPKFDEFPKALWPNHKNAVAKADGKVRNFRDRFRVQVWDNPATTITAHIRKDGHYFIHPDYRQVRSLTVREAARLQTFPDNYFFEGNRTAQFQQVGNAVPPFLAYQLAQIVAEVIRECRDLAAIDTVKPVAGFAIA